jgi:ABC-2 type transport system ATP-binding protein
VNAEIIKNEILELRRQGVTIMLSTHRMESVELLCDQIAMINRSEKILDGTIQQIKNEAKTDVFRVKMIPDTMDFVPQGEDLRRQDGMLEFKVRLNNQQPNDLLRALMQQGQVLGFDEIVPSIEEIFIKKINDSHGE